MCNNKEIKYISEELELLDMIRFSNCAELAKEYMLIHDIALYHSDICIDQNEKTALFDLKQLSEMLLEISLAKSTTTCE